MFRILEYVGLDTRRVSAQYAKLTAAIRRGDFRSADVKKLAVSAATPYYRAKLDDSNRLVFTLLRHQDTACALMLEVIHNHDYAGSRFLRGALIDETKIPSIDAAQASTDAPALRFLHPQHTQIHLLDKPLSFDDAQHAVYQQSPPLVIVGSAGSGKTALTLEKLKAAEGEVLYVTHSAYLAQSARDLYFANDFANPKQDATFLSYREFLESLEVPHGRELTWQRFNAWHVRMQQGFKGIDAHQAFEEIRGVITAQETGELTREQYLALGVRQSIFSEDQRPAVYELYQKYLVWLNSDDLFDLNLLAHERMDTAQPRYDFVVIDEVQDLTMVQLALVLRTLRKPGQFLLCGDSNQIVHPNFFSWSQVKTLFWRDPEKAARQQLCVLSANFRNAEQTTRLANTLLKIKHRRFGSIDRESNFLVQSIGAESGQASLLADRDAALRQLDQQTRKSAQVAVLVMRDEDKVAARQRFATPLLFSVHEAKGLEYEHIVLYRFVSDHRAEFAAVAEGVAADDLLDDSLQYRRARDKSDKSLEVYKFFVNALYVALTRAVKNVYMVESDLAHPLLQLLQINEGDAAGVKAQASTEQDWQREARRLELQGKREQAEAIRRDILHQAKPPWQVFDGEYGQDCINKLFIERYPGGKLKRQLQEYAVIYDQTELTAALAAELQFGSVDDCRGDRDGLIRKHLGLKKSNNIKDVLRQCQQYGVDHRSPMNLTPLIMATVSGNVALVQALCERGADLQAADNYGQTALHWAIRESIVNPEYGREVFTEIYSMIAPSSIDLQSSRRLVRIDRHLAEYPLVQTLWALMPMLTGQPFGSHRIAINAPLILEIWEQLPTVLVGADRRRRQYISGVLSRNEVDRDYAYNRALFKRVTQGWYQFAPDLAIRVNEGSEPRWVALADRFNLPLLLQSAHPVKWGHLRKMIAERQPELDREPATWSKRLEQQRQAQQAREREAEHRRQLAIEARRNWENREQPWTDADALRQARPLVDYTNPDYDGPEPAWGTKAAKLLALARASRLRKPNKES